MFQTLSHFQGFFVPASEVQVVYVKGIALSIEPFNPLLVCLFSLFEIPFIVKVIETFYGMGFRQVRFDLKGLPNGDNGLAQCFHGTQFNSEHGTFGNSDVALETVGKCETRVQFNCLHNIFLGHPVTCPGIGGKFIIGFHIKFIGYRIARISQVQLRSNLRGKGDFHMQSHLFSYFILHLEDIIKFFIEVLCPYPVSCFPIDQAYFHPDHISEFLYTSF